MALTAAKSPQGLAFHRHWTEGAEVYVPANPGITIARGDNLAIGAAAGAHGVAILSTDSLATSIGRASRSQVVPAATQAFPVPANHVPDGGAADLTLVPVRPQIAAGTPVFLATFKNHKDDTVITYTSSTRAIACTTGFTADDYPNGAWLYVYEGTGAGQVNIVEDYDHTGGAAELLLICHRPFATDLDSTSKFIVVSGEASADLGIGSFGRIDLADEDELDAADGANDGDYVVVMDFLRAPQYLRNLTLPVVSARALYVS